MTTREHKHHALLHGLTVGSEVYRDAILSIFAGPPHHEEWEDALERWNSESHPFPVEKRST